MPFSDERFIFLRQVENMNYTSEEILQYVEEKDVKFIRLAFCDVFGLQKNISIMPGELKKALSTGIAIDGSAVRGFSTCVHSDLFLHPDCGTLSVLPWRPEHGRVVRMFCSVTYPDGTPFEGDLRHLLKKAVKDAEDKGEKYYFGAEMEFYLFKLDENGEKTLIPYDNAGYMDIAPEDKGENVRREICLTLEQMGIIPESSHHEEGPGQNEIDFRYSDPVTAADNAVTFKSVVNTVAARNGLWASFSPRPLKNCPGNGMHINISAKSEKREDVLSNVIEGILKRSKEITAFLNVCEESYLRLGRDKAPKFISWSNENRSQLIRVPAAEGEFKRAELRSPDPLCNPYLAFYLIMKAAGEGIEENYKLRDPKAVNMFALTEDELIDTESLPENLEEAKSVAKQSDFIRENLPESVIGEYIS